MIERNDDTTPEPASIYYHHGWRWWLEGFYIWLGKRLPPGLVYRAVNQLTDFCEEKGLPVYDIIEAQSWWADEKMP